MTHLFSLRQYVRNALFCFSVVFSLALIAALTALPASSAHAALLDAGTDEVKVALIAQYEAVRPGETILIGLRQTIKPHWHTYWRNPGDSGIATSITWSLPLSVRSEEIQWPTPSRIQIGDIINYGYENAVTLLTPITIPKNATPGSALPIKAKVNWLVCKDVCIPQQADLALTLSVASDQQNRAPANPEIAKAQATLPVASPWTIKIESGASTNVAENVAANAAANAATNKLAIHINNVLNSTTGHAADNVTKNIQEIWFFPYQPGVIKDNAPQRLSLAGNDATIGLTAGDIRLAQGESIAGLISITTTDQRTQAYTFTAPVSVVAGLADVGSLQGDGKLAGAGAGSNSDSGADNHPAVSGDTTTSQDIGIVVALLFAFFGGVILNLMPCVFPVLSLKALAMVNHAHHDQRTTRLHGVSYTAGVLLSFALLGAVLVALKAGGAQVGWGFQFQSPLFVLAVAYLIFGVGLNLSGVITPGSSLTGIGSSLADRSGYSGSFFTGVLATVVATPCTAPFMGGAIGYALVQPAAVLIAVLLSMGLGLALPYLLLSLWPTLQRWLPRPGKWMERMKQGLAFPMYATAIWLVWVLAQQAGANAIVIALGGMLLIAFAAWLFDTTRYSSAAIRHSASAAALALVVVAIAGGYFGVGSASSLKPAAGVSTHLSEPYSAAKLQRLHADGKPVFINLTAAWCITCLVNERVALSTDTVTSALQSNGITYLKGDWTNQDPEISQLLKEFGRNGVPLYIFYPSGRDSKAVVLPQLLTPELVVGYLIGKN